ncbi:helix-turn-helix domain-containing protein [Massilia oculi]|jgi:transcriptional regulator with XRE-family HTH domain|uniref:Helix-turn-helix domain-containing protein n=2 Tax=Massilia TaxID=149698 RepID=A0A5C7G5I9_9BURK|nr:hypothetical protein DIR46_00490 [Massilia oculi]QYG02700.1 helix-turn-helix domain-containing protein [Massilia sp. NP310]TXG00618.1 helix-turn-helix domain-containing protein [Massilia arenae]
MRAAETNFGSELYALRIRTGVTQADVASRAGLGRGYYSQLENSRKGPPSTLLLCRIVEALELSDAESHRLFAVAVADRCAATCHSSVASTSIAPLVKSLIQSAPRITHEQAARIAAILKEE